MDKIIIIGAGGHSKVLIDLIQQADNFNLVGLTDKNLPIGKKVLGIPVLGNDAILPNLIAKGIKLAAVGVGSIKDNKIRKKLYEQALNLGFVLPPLKHPSAIIAKNVQIEAGVQIMAGAIIQTNAKIGKNTIINTGAQIDHDCLIGQNVHIAPGAMVSGGVVVEDGAFVGVGAIIIQNITIGQGAIVGAGAVVIKNVPAKTQVVGVPAK